MITLSKFLVLSYGVFIFMLVCKVQLYKALVLCGNRKISTSFIASQSRMRKGVCDVKVSDLCVVVSMGCCDARIGNTWRVCLDNVLHSLNKMELHSESIALKPTHLKSCAHFGIEQVLRALPAET